MLLFLAACTDHNVSKVTPELKVQPESIDFGEVVVGTQSGISVGLTNEGAGRISFSDVSLDPSSSPDFEILEYPTGEIGTTDEGVLSVQYTPDAEGGDAGIVLLQMDLEDTEPVEVPLVGVGVIPCIDIDPETLYFGTVSAGQSVTLSTRIGASSSCSGGIRLRHVAFAGDEAAAYAFTLPDDWAEPYALDRGASFSMDVTFTPPDDAEYRGYIYVESNDPETPTAAIQLIGNSTDDPTVNEAPTCEILDPNDGEYFMDDEEVAFSGSVFDPDEPVTNLLCGWYVDGSRVGSPSSPGGDGTVSGASLLPTGDISLALRCFDSEGASCEDSAVVTVWPHDEPVMYTISGGESPFDYFSVDDDISFALNGVPIYADVDATKTTLPPVEFQAQRGDVITITAIDQNYSDAVLDALTLHWGTGQSQPLNDAVCKSANPEGACYDGSYNGPWPGVYYEEDFTISIP